MYWPTLSAGILPRCQKSAGSAPAREGRTPALCNLRGEESRSPAAAFAKSLLLLTTLRGCQSKEHRMACRYAMVLHPADAPQDATLKHKLADHNTRRPRAEARRGEENTSARDQLTTTALDKSSSKGSQPIKLAVNFKALSTPDPLRRDSAKPWKKGSQC